MSSKSGFIIEINRTGGIYAGKPYWSVWVGSKNKCFDLDKEKEAQVWLKEMMLTHVELLFRKERSESKKL